MRRSNIIIGIILATMTAVGYGQLAWVEGKTHVEIFWERMRSKRSVEVHSFSVAHSADRDRIEYWMHDLRSWAHESNADHQVKRTVSESPDGTGMVGDKSGAFRGSETGFKVLVGNSADMAVIENEIALEPWMAAPFDAGVNEQEIALEPWMAAPFDAGVNEQEIALEPWMAAPFDAGVNEQEIALEPWMAAPFDAGVNEQEIALEPWMAAPFDAGVNEQEIALEPWMAAPFDAGVNE